MSDTLPKMTSGLLAHAHCEILLWQLGLLLIELWICFSQRWKLSYQSSFDKKVSCRKLFLFLCTWIYGLRKLPLFLSQEYLFYKLFTCLHITFSNKCKLTTWCKTAIIYFLPKFIIDICLIFHSQGPLEISPHIPLATQVLILANYVGLFHCGKNSIHCFKEYCKEAAGIVYIINRVFCEFKMLTKGWFFCAHITHIFK